MVETLITSSIIIGILCILRPLLKNRVSASVRYSLWGIVAARLIYPAFFLFPGIKQAGSRFSVMNLVDRLFQKGGKYAALTANGLFAAPYQGAGTGGAAGLAAGKITEIQAAQTIQAVQTAQPGAGLTRALAVVDWKIVLTVIWVAGSVGLLIWFAAVNLHFVKKIKKNRKVWTGVLPVETAVPVYRVSGIFSPCYVTVSGSRGIYLPEDISDHGEILRHILAHETGHLRHHDEWWGILRCLLLCCYWINPLVWLAAGLAKRDCELACDEAAVHILGETERFTYGKTLIALSERREEKGGFLCAASDIGGGKRMMKERVKALARRPKMTASVLAVTLAVAAALIICTFTGKAGTPEKTDDPGGKIPVPSGRVTMEDVIKMAALPKDGNPDAYDTLPEPDKVSGADEDDSLTYIKCYNIPWYGEEYELQISIFKEENRLDYVSLMRSDTGEILYLYSTPEEVKRYGLHLAEGDEVREFTETHGSMGDYLTYQLPEGLFDGDFLKSLGNGGGNLFLTDDKMSQNYLQELSELIDKEAIPPEWYSAGGTVRWVGGFPARQFESGNLIRVSPPWNHSDFTAEPLSVAGCEAPALLIPVSHDLYTPASLEETEKLHGPIPEKKRTSRMWYVFFSKPDCDEVYTVYLNADLYSQEDAIRLARSVHFKEGAFTAP